MIQFLTLMNCGKLLDEDSTTVMWKMMEKTSTGSVNRLVPETVTFVRKTGYSGANIQGIIAAQNNSRI